MNKFNQIESVSAELIASSMDMEYKGVMSRVYVLVYEGKEYAVITSLDESDSDVVLYSLSKSISETIHAEYNCLFWDLSTIKYFMSNINGE
ncbi:hypothetical protein A4L30_23340 [Salmonella enterica subsp. enterica serovar Bovismorbificans]|nr:hypothetical protein [Salmonella enterica subsp. enterica serovar Bovismorbificans]